MLPDDPSGAAPSAFGALRQFARRSLPEEQCELCSAGLPHNHQHLLALDSRQLLCACDACALLFIRPDAGKYRRVPRRARWLGDFHMSDADWLALAIPVNMAFFFFHSGAGRVQAYYPSPAGPTESLLPLETWQSLVRDNPPLAGLEPDVEALLVNRLGTRREYYLAPIDRCYELVGLIRIHWRGLSGGAEVWREIESFFAGLRKQTGAPAASATASGAAAAAADNQ
jgi:hypothetical protein